MKSRRKKSAMYFLRVIEREDEKLVNTLKEIMFGVFQNVNKEK